MNTAEARTPRGPDRRYLRVGELYAIRSNYVQYDVDRKAFFWLFGPPVKENERFGNVSVVRINGPLEYHDDCWSDSYEAIVCRIQQAASGEDMIEKEKQRRRYAAWDGIEVTDPMPEPQKPACIVMRIDSPGGVVSGLNQTVDTIIEISNDTKIPIFAYPDETAYSAAMALCCAATGGIYMPKSGMIGSIGVISTMVDESKLDEKLGLKFVVLTSGKRKADGHPHVPITDDMIAEEEPRVATLAGQFFQLVSRARGIPVDTIQGWEAKRFLGDEATKANLADELIDWRVFLKTLQNRYLAPGMKGLSFQVPGPSRLLLGTK